LLRYGRKLDRGCADKRARSNRGRARTSATADDRRHANLGSRRGQDQAVEIRADKKRSRLAARLLVEDELFDLELAARDPETWLHGTDLTTVEDTVTKHHRGYPFSFHVDPYEYVPDAFDWDLEGSAYRDAEDEFRHLYDEQDYDLRDYDWDDAGSHPDPEPVDAAWRDLWVEGYVCDPEGRDQSSTHDGWYDDYYDYDYLADLKNPLLEREDAMFPVSIEAVEERASERRRAGERYFRQTGRTVPASPLLR